MTQVTFNNDGTVRGSEEMNPNVAVIRVEGVRSIRGTVPRQVRSALMNAVKDGILGHLKKDGLKPEMFFHPNSIWRAKEEQSRIAIESVESIRKVLA